MFAPSFTYADWTWDDPVAPKGWDFVAYVAPSFVVVDGIEAIEAALTEEMWGMLR